MAEPGAILLMGERSSSSKDKGEEGPDPRKEAARAMMSAIKKDDPDAFLSALDGALDLREPVDEPSLDDLEDLE